MIKTIITNSVLLICCLLLAIHSYAQISTVAGKNALGAGYSGNGGPAIAAQLNSPIGIAFDATGNMYIADRGNNVIRKVTTAGIISTVAGNNALGAGYSGDGGAATAAQLNFPFCIAFDAAGNMYIADAGNNVIRKVTTAGIISTVAGKNSLGAGYTGDGGAATAAQLNYPFDIAFDATGNLYIADISNNVVRKVTTAGIISTVAGNGISGYSGDGGAATAAHFSSPENIAFDAAGNMYISDNANYVIRKVTTAGIISTVAGNHTSGYSGDGGAATAAQLNLPSGIAFDAAGNLYIADFSNNVIREVTASSLLPIQLISFTGSVLNDKIIISWQTASERNNSFFTLEKSINGIAFQELCRNTGAINSSLVNSYNCEDPAPIHGQNYYRLKQTDVDGHEQIFDIISVNYTENNELQLFPNPAGEDRIVHLSLTMGGSVNEISVYNSLNEMVFQNAGLDLSMGRDLDMYSIQLSPQLSAGLYHLKVNTTSNVFTQNLLLVK